MIAKDAHFGQDDLIGLLQESLPPEQETRITAHLEQCATCRHTLQELVGGENLWQEAVQVLSDTDWQPAFHAAYPPAMTSGAVKKYQGDAAPSLPQDPTGWVRPLLSPCNSEDTLGLLEQRPVHSVIGQGGMGVVLKVWDPKLNRFLAAKLLSPMLASHGAARQRFFREAQSAAAVVHPNIVPIYDICTDFRLPYILMPVVEGGSLQQRIEQHGPLPIDEVLSIGLQIAEALHAAHQQGLIHRDIKPANILLEQGGRRVMLTDFGLARTLDDASMTASGMISGTPHYMSPEQAQGKHLDGRSDLYGLGAVLYTMATGHPPVRGSSPLEVLRKVAEENVTPPSHLNETLPLWFDQLMIQFLAKQRDHRLDHAQQAAEVLRGCLAHLRSPRDTRLPAIVQSHRWSLIAWLAIVLVIGLMLGLISSLRPAALSWPTTATAVKPLHSLMGPADAPSEDPSIASRNPTSPEMLDTGPTAPGTDNAHSPATLPAPVTRSYNAFESEWQLHRQLQQIEYQLQQLNRELEQELNTSRSWQPTIPQ